METVLKVEHLYKSFGKKTIISDVSLETYAGEVFGFLGPNGAGKSTVIKMITGLLDPDSGTISICGHDRRREFEAALEGVGGVVENPELYQYMTGLQNLRQYARIRPDITEQRIRDVVEQVGLSARINDKIKKYSLGMKQRLGLAQALLHSPKLLILDEPTNGLDPAGIKELRDLLVRTAHENNVSVFVSSHLLSEMQLMCDRVGIIMNGRLMGEKTVAELMSEANGGGVRYRFTVNSLALAQAALAAFPPEKTTAVGPNWLELAIDGDNDLAAVNAALVGGGVLLLGVTKLEKSFEDIFIEMTGNGGGQIA